MSRVQGGWAKDRGQVRTNIRPTPVVSPPTNFNVTYQDNSPQPRVKPEDIIVKSSGELTLSLEPSGLSKISLFPDFLTTEDADKCFATLHEELPWQQNRDKYGAQPRLTVWYGAHPYSYSGLKHEAYEQWHPLLLEIREKLEKLTGNTFNSVLCNLYRDNRDSVDWHCDDEPGLRKNPFIASVSLGEVRVFEMRKKPPPELFGNFDYAQHVKMHLPHGSLVIMEGSTQDDWQHRVPKEYHDRGPRINLTFRTIYSEEN